MKRLLPIGGALIALALLLGVGVLLLGGGPSPEPVAPPPPPPRPVRPKPAIPKPAELPLPGEDDGSSEEPAVPAPKPEEEEPPLALDAYPHEVPPWWIEKERRLREVEVEITGETLTIEEILQRVTKATGFPVRAGNEVSGYASSTHISLPSTRGPARGLIEALALRCNMEPVLTTEGLVMHQRGKVPPGRIVQAGRVQWSLIEARERREGKRSDDPTAAEARALPLNVGFSKTPLREVARILGEKTSIPVYLDVTLHTVNPPVTLDAKDRTLGETLDAILGPLKAASDSNLRRVLLFKP